MHYVFQSEAKPRAAYAVEKKVDTPVDVEKVKRHGKQEVFAARPDSSVLEKLQRLVENQIDRERQCAHHDGSRIDDEHEGELSRFGRHLGLIADTFLSGYAHGGVLGAPHMHCDDDVPDDDGDERENEE